MPIHPATIELYGRPILVFNADQTLRDAMRALIASGLKSNAAYLVIIHDTESATKYCVESFLRIMSLARLMDYDSLDTQLDVLSLRPVSRVVATDIDERVKDVLDWVGSNPSSSALITRDDFPVGLFTATELSISGVLDRFGLSRLHGEFVNLTQEPRAIFDATAEIPICPKCGEKNRFRYEISAIVCPECGYRESLI